MGKALIIKNADFSSVKVATIDIIVEDPVVLVTIAGLVTINSDNDVYFTLDGSTPTNESTKYTGPFNVTIPQGDDNVTIKAVAYNGSNHSEVVEAVYDGSLQAPTISISPKGVATITASEDAEHIYYTTDGITPTTSSTEYTEPISGLENGQEVKAIATAASGAIVSDVTSATAVVVEGIKAGKKFKGMSNSTLPNETADSNAYADDPTRFVSPKINVSGGSSISWTYTGATYGTDGLVEFNSNGKVINRNNTSSAQVTSSSRTITTNANTAYVRFSNLMGANYAGAKVSSGGTTLWAYQGETD